MVASRMKISTINSVELSSKCDNSCEYCPAPVQHKYRETGFMQWNVFKKTIEYINHFCKQNTQREINLFGVGEPTLNPHCIEMVMQDSVYRCIYRFI